MAHFQSLFSVLVLLACSTLCSAFVITLQSEDEFVEATESYKAVVVHLHDPSSPKSLQYANRMRIASRKLVPKIQPLLIDVTNDDFQNLLPTLTANGKRGKVIKSV